VQQTMGHEFRARSVESVLREIEECVERYDIRHFDIEDDNFTFNQRRAEEIMTAVLDRFGEGALRFSAMNGLTATQLSETLLKRMHQAGFHQVNLSLVASQPQKLRQLKRPVSLSGFKQTIEKARRVDLECVGYFILGLPGDNCRRMLETLVELAGLPVLVGPSVFYVSPGTELFDALSDRVPENWDLLRSSTFYMESGSSTLLERITVFRLARLVNFLKERLDAGRWEFERNEAIEWLGELQVESQRSQVAGRKSQVETGKAQVAGRKSQVTFLECQVPRSGFHLQASCFSSSGSHTRGQKEMRNLRLETRNKKLGTRDPKVETCDLRPATCDLSPLRLSSETILGWAVLHLLRQTGRFHAACRRRRGGRVYEFESLLTCGKTIADFFEISRNAQLCGIRTHRQVEFDELLRESSTHSAPPEPRASASGLSI
ncbi:MAG TPA: radical SAM protein, partial [Acidobacteriota bacterium]